jgi:hypothetical protein
MVSFTPRPIYPSGKSPRYQLNRRLGDNLRANTHLLPASSLPYSSTLKVEAVSFSRQGQKSFPFSTTSRSALGPIQRTRGSLSPGIKRPGHEASHSSPSSAEVKNGRATPPLPHTSLSRGAELIKHRDDFTLITLPMLIFPAVLLPAPFPSPFVSSPLHTPSRPCQHAFITATRARGTDGPRGTAPGSQQSRAPPMNEIPIHL